MCQTNRDVHGVDEPVALEVWVKNVPRLLVKVYEINARAYYTSKLAEVPNDIDLVRKRATATRLR